MVGGERRQVLRVIFVDGTLGYAEEKRQRAGAVQDAGANDGGPRLREASWTAVALYRSCGSAVSPMISRNAGAWPLTGPTAAAGRPWIFGFWRRLSF